MKINEVNTYPKYGKGLSEEKIDLSSWFIKYLKNWKWFTLALIICLGVAYAYLKRTSPTYEVSAKILLESTTDDANTLQSFGLFNIKDNTENELQVLNTTYLMELAVRKLDLYATYTDVSGFQHKELYGTESPISVKLPSATLNALREKIQFDVEIHENGSYVFTGEYLDKEFITKASNKDSMVVLPFGMILVAPGIFKPNTSMKLAVTLENPTKVADRFLSNTTISQASKTTTVINVDMKTPNINKGKDFINTFIETYKAEDVKSQNFMAENTTKYLNNLLLNLGNELNDVEKRVENFKQHEGLTDINSEAQLYIQYAGQYEERNLAAGTQLGIIKDLESYINKDENQYQLLPSGIGLQNTTLNTLISEYNNLLLDRKRLSRTATENNQAMIDLNDRIKALYKTVQSSISNEKRNLMISQQDITRKNRENAARIQSIPRQQRAISDLSRQQNVKSQLYLLLLQKRDENYLNMSSVTPKFKVISYPHSNGSPIAPKPAVIYFLALICGILFPVLGIYFHEILRYQIANKEELQILSPIPFLGEIPKSEKSKYIIVNEHATDGLTEMFRLLRTNLMFVLNEPTKKVINVVSSISGEGKTVLTINLALSLALLEKKVLVICLDIRKPKMNEVLGFDNSSGLTQYLSGQILRSRLIHPSGIHPKLWVIPTGPIPPNPNELLAKSTLDDLITTYRELFDYIIIDTPPIGIVSDTLLLNRFADVNLFIVRADYTPRRAILEANELFKNEKLKNMYVVLNAADMRKSPNYRYSFKNKYGYKYGYGYYSQNLPKTKEKKALKVLNVQDANETLPN